MTQSSAPKNRESLPAGVWGVVATPFQGSTLDVDLDSLAELVEHYESIGATGLTVLGVFGEAAALTAEERSQVLETVVECTSLPLVVGVTALATRPAIEEVRAAQGIAGTRLAAVMVQANSANPQAVITHMDAIHRATGANVVLQDYPLASGVSIPTKALITVVTSCGYVVAVKAEAPPTSVAIAELSAAVGVSIFGGLGGQGLLDELMSGAAGAMTGFSYPEALIACVRAWQEDGYEAAQRELLPYLPLINFEQQAKVALAIRKECLRERGLIKDSGVRAPAAGFPEDLRTSMGTHLREAAAALENTKTPARSF
ncbi:dihydrodipicolinate synthase family protein [Arthrobacter sp. MYb23]|uniref:dihydrodipicolinate synthase family protein n=1 Tax=unclassified Arthrobacter TaxID=235627 RepID=UPI000CFC2FC7|nr:MULTISPECIES: dihydrodipicolinate synthase family protein [unclassified Arthrobacter]PRB42648.1 dihydrodipicolinate synthase family protein [Arthrobacter sp. MYb51]PRB96675.1 dihydrodipicolinate synthase family protein [Arthrobacter sp. MYb23]